MSSASPTNRTALDRFLAALPYALLALALLSLLFWEAAIRKTPTIFTDELEWSQLSRSIAATGHAARRGAPFSYKSLYAFLIAPGWWITSTSSAYTAIKYLNTVVMALTAVPTFLIARTMVPTRTAAAAAFAAVCTSALFYAGYLVPEVLAYPTFAVCAYVSIRALAGAGRRWIVTAVVLDVLGTQVRGELVTVPAAFGLAAVILWVAGPRVARFRAGWSRRDYAGVAVLVVGVLVFLNAILSQKSFEWATVTREWKGRMWSLGFQASSALAIGLGLLPVVGGLASLWLPERRRDPAWRAFAAFLGASIFTVWTYTAIKAAYLSTVFATRVEERNLIYLGPLLIVGTAAWAHSQRRFLAGSLAAWGFTTWLVLYYGYQLDYPYFEAPGYGVAAMANRVWHWDQPAIRVALAIAALVLLVTILLLSARRAPRAVGGALLALLAVTTVTWMLAGEITSVRGSAAGSRTYADSLPQPLDWIDRATHGSPATFLGENISSGQALGINLTEFWNRSVHNVWSLDGSAPGPGPTLTPDLRDRNGTLSHDPGLRFVVASDRVNLAAPAVARRRGVTLRELTSHPWRLRDAEYGVSDDGWISGTSDSLMADGVYGYFGPERFPGKLHVDVSRVGFCAPDAPPTHVVVRVGPLELNGQRAPSVPHATQIRRFVLANCARESIEVVATPPVAVEVHVAPTVRPSDYGISDSRELGAQVGFRFTRR